MAALGLHGLEGGEVRLFPPGLNTERHPMSHYRNPGFWITYILLMAAGFWAGQRSDAPLFVFFAVGFMSHLIARLAWQDRTRI